MKQLIIMGCVPVEDDTLDIVPAPGSIKARCEVCLDEIWLGLKQQEVRDECHLVCYPCLIVMGNMTPDSIIKAKIRGDIQDLGGPSATIKKKNQDN